MSILTQLGPTVSIVGLGYVGTPLGLLSLAKGFQVIGIDVDAKKIQSLKDGKSYLTDVSDEELVSAWKTGRFQVTTDFTHVSETDTIIICVPTPLTGYATPDLSYLQSAAGQMKPHLRKGQLIVLESSTYPGTTEEVLAPMLESDGWKIGEDIFLAYSPERIDPGNHNFSIDQIPKIISGMTDACRQKISQIYGQIFSRIIPVSNTRTAEMIKIVENSQRFINISFVNELSAICREMNISIWEVINNAATKPFGFTPYYPGPGVGGHCIPVDPLYLKWKANQSGLDTRFIDLAHRINHDMPMQVINLLRSGLQVKTLRDRRIFIIGVTYKKDVNDIRESPPLAVIEQLLEQGADVSYHDPHVPSLTAGARTLTSLPLSEEPLKSSDCVLILTDHSSIDYQWITREARLIVDTRNATKDVLDRSNIILL